MSVIIEMFNRHWTEKKSKSGARVFTSVETFCKSDAIMEARQMYIRKCRDLGLDPKCSIASNKASAWISCESEFFLVGYERRGKNAYKLIYEHYNRG